MNHNSKIKMHTTRRLCGNRSVCIKSLSAAYGDLYAL